MMRVVAMILAAEFNYFYLVKLGLLRSLRELLWSAIELHLFIDEFVKVLKSTAGISASI